MSIDIRNLSYTYMKGSPYEKTALNNITLRIEKGEFVAIIGRTGSGKSTLVQHLNGILKPSFGKVLINGEDTKGKNLRELRKHVGMVFQYPEYQLFEETVYKDIAFGLKKLGLGEKEMDDRIHEISEIVGLSPESLQKSPFELSGGQKRRAAIAGVLVMKPGILVLDEPAAGLDPVGRKEIFSFINGLYRDTGITIVFVSHNMEDVARLAKRIIVLEKGSVFLDGSSKEIFSDIERLENAGLAAPQITYLMRRLKEYVPEINATQFTVEGAKQEIMKYLNKDLNKVFDKDLNKGGAAATC
ncbi:MAG: energy-coupling factor transporter ATPase [Clostridiales bacterium]|nr:energy-coupling factor transporter ATPase [Clostridiales bacterium]